MRKIVWPRFGFQNLLIWLFVYLTVSPFLAAIPYATFILEASLTAVLISALYAVKKEKKVLAIAITLLTLTLTLHWLGSFGIIRYHGPLIYFFMAMYYATLIHSFVVGILRARQVTSNLICAALCLYLFIGLLWGSIFAFVESLFPGSFSGALLNNAASPEEFVHSFVYFSYITLTTLGYGDILPQTQGATALCQAEAILGQFFVAVLVARLVALEILHGTSGGDL